MKARGRESKLYNLKKRKPLPKKVRKEVYKLHKHMCQYCGDKERLHVHHEDLNPENNELDNLSLLCYICHSTEHPDKADEIIEWELFEKGQFRD